MAFAVFLSSTFKELRDERAAVEAVINRMALTYIGMEHFGSFAATPLDRCREAVGTSDLLVLLLGQRYGDRPSGSLLSYTEAEFREAIRLGKPVLVYFAGRAGDDSVPNDPRVLRELKAELLNTHGVSYFSSPEDLAWKVATDLHRHVPSTLRATHPVDRRLDELVALFEHRAQTIERTLSQHYAHSDLGPFLKEFRQLHSEHIAHVRNGHLFLAHELVGRIHALSYELESEEFMQRGFAEHGIGFALRQYSANFREMFAHGVIRIVYSEGLGGVSSADKTVESAEAAYSRLLHPQ